MIAGAAKRSDQVRPGTELRHALLACRSAFIGIGVMSGLINLLMLTGSLYMLEVYDRVLPSRSVPTLVGLTLLVGVLFLFHGLLDAIRARVLIRIGNSLDEELSPKVFNALVRLPLRAKVTSDGLQPLRDLDQVRSYIGGPGPAALFDLPWMPVYLGICFAFHPLIGVAALCGGVILIALTITTEIKTKAPMAAASQHGAQRNALAEASRRNAEVLQALGMAGNLSTSWAKSNAQYMEQQRRANDVTATIGSVSRIVRLALQSGVLGIGAYLVIYQLATPGIIIAASILTSRALAPVEMVIGSWKGFVAARQGWRRLSELLRVMGSTAEPMQLDDAKEKLAVAAAAVVPPGGRTPVASDITFSLTRGDGLGIIGPSASGKSSLARALVGVWPLARGSIRLDGAALDQWAPDQLGRNIGYLPQDVELFAGTVAANIARFEPESNSAKVVEAAKVAGVHELILNLPQGYDTDIGDRGAALSAGQRQRIALARCLYREPFLVVLDEPNSNLDAAGDEALTKAIHQIRQRGGIVIVIAHRPAALAGVNSVMVMTDNKMQDIGPKDEIMKRLLRPAQRGPEVAAPLRVAPGA